MSTVNLKQGDTLNIIWTSKQDTPFGVKEVESSFAFTYEDLLLKLRKRKSKKSRVKGKYFSRLVSLSCYAMIKGRWSSGSIINRNRVLNNLTIRFNELDKTDYKDITKMATNKLYGMLTLTKVLTEEQREMIQFIVNKMKE